jgi:hypothetical protein
LNKGVEKMQTHITAETIDQILQKEQEVKEKACDNEGNLRSIHGALEEGLSGSG